MGGEGGGGGGGGEEGEEGEGGGGGGRGEELGEEEGGEGGRRGKGVDVSVVYVERFGVGYEVIGEWHVVNLGRSLQPISSYACSSNPNNPNPICLTIHSRTGFCLTLTKF